MGLFILLIRITLGQSTWNSQPSHVTSLFVCLACDHAALQICYSFNVVQPLFIPLTHVNDQRSHYIRKSNTQLPMALLQKPRAYICTDSIYSATKRIYALAEFCPFNGVSNTFCRPGVQLSMQYYIIFLKHNHDNQITAPRVCPVSFKVIRP